MHDQLGDTLLHLSALSVIAKSGASRFLMGLDAMHTGLGFRGLFVNKYEPFGCNPPTTLGPSLTHILTPNQAEDDILSLKIEALTAQITTNPRPRQLLTIAAYPCDGLHDPKFQEQFPTQVKIVSHNSSRIFHDARQNAFADRQWQSIPRAAGLEKSGVLIMGM